MWQMNSIWLDEGLCGVYLYLTFNPTFFVKQTFSLPADFDDILESDLKFFLCNITVNIVKNRLDENTAHYFYKQQKSRIDTCKIKIVLDLQLSAGEICSVNDPLGA